MFLLFLLIGQFLDSMLYLPMSFVWCYCKIENLKMALSNKEAQRALLNRTKEPQTPSEKTPLRLRRLSIENSMKPEDKSGTKSPSFLPRSRRLSLEGSKSTTKKDTVQPKVTTDATKPQQFDSVSHSVQKIRPLQDAEAASKLHGHFSNSSIKAPRSPTSIAYQKRAIKIDCGTQIHPLKLPQTPETQGFDRNNAYKAIRTDTSAPTDFQTPNAISSTNSKGSQIRRSLRTIGKLINGPEKRWVTTRK